MPILSGVRAEWGVRGSTEGDIGENCEGEGAGDVKPGGRWEAGGAEGGGMRALRTLLEGF